MMRMTRLMKTTIATTTALALSTLAAIAATFAQPPTVNIQAPASVQQGHDFTVSGTVTGTGVGSTVVTITANGVKKDNSVSIAVEGTTPVPFEVKFHASGHTGGSIDVTATAVGDSDSGPPLITSATTTVKVTHGKSGK